MPATPARDLRPQPSPALVQSLVDDIVPACTNCDFIPVVIVDVKPGSTGCINPRSNGVFPVAILGSVSFSVADVRAESLRLGSLKVRVQKGRPTGSIDRVNGDAFDDLVCHFGECRRELVRREEIASHPSADTTADRKQD